jgi:ribonucleoside-diphosphate reductase beta chain
MGIFPGMNQILSWSVRDEDMHSVCAISLFKELIKQYPKARPTQKVLYEYFDATVEIEKLFLSQVFNLGSLSSGIVYQDALDFIYHRANLKLKQLGYTPKYKEGNNPFASWFYSLTSTVPLNDFFAQQHNGAAYAAKISQDFTNVTYNF